MSGANDHLRETAWALLAPGFMSYSEVVVLMRELAEDDAATATDPNDAEALVDELWKVRLAELRALPGRVPTDDARLDAAFAELNQAGIAAMMNCGVDQGDGAYLSQLQAHAMDARGYVFFHVQDTERLVGPNAELYLAFGSVSESSLQMSTDDAAVAIAREVVQVLGRHGLTVRWDGSGGPAPGSYWLGLATTAAGPRAPSGYDAVHP